MCSVCIDGVNFIIRMERQTSSQNSVRSFPLRLGSKLIAHSLTYLALQMRGDRSKLLAVSVSPCGIMNGSAEPITSDHGSTSFSCSSHVTRTNTNQQRSIIGETTTIKRHIIHRIENQRSLVFPSCRLHLVCFLLKTTTTHLDYIPYQIFIFELIYTYK